MNLRLYASSFPAAGNNFDKAVANLKAGLVFNENVWLPKTVWKMYTQRLKRLRKELPIHTHIL